jgi:hypothetical protein
MPLPAPRPPAGPAQGALAGYYPAPSLGAPPLAGMALWDEFNKPPGATTMGDLDWTLNSYGSAPNAVNVIPSADSEIGITRVLTAVGATLNEGGLLTWGVPSMYQAPGPGALVFAKLRLETTVNTMVFSGMTSATLLPTGATVVSAVGVRGVGGGNWSFVVRSGAVESVLDSGVAADGTWQILALERNPGDGSWLCWVLYCANVLTGPQWMLKGQIPGTNTPIVPMMYVPLFVVNTAVLGAQREADIDFFGVGGALPR